jgi:hypothetical protein
MTFTVDANYSDVATDMIKPGYFSAVFFFRYCSPACMNCRHSSLRTPGIPSPSKALLPASSRRWAA